MNPNSEKCGEINEEGFVLSMNKLGFTKFKCLGELISNAIDAGAKNVRFHILDEMLWMLDDGNGMDKSKVKDMFSVHRENHKESTTMGTAGIGGKIATKILSQRNSIGTETEVKMITRCKYSNNFITVKMPWDEIVREKKYTGKIALDTSSESEIHEFLELRKKNDFSEYGTTICFKLNDENQRILDKQFNILNSNEDEQIQISEQLSNIFGRFDVNISYRKNLATEPIKLKLYDYFGDEQLYYYDGKDEHEIKLYKDNKKKINRYVFKSVIDDTNIIKNVEFKKDGRGFGQKPSEITDGELNLLEPIGILTLFIGMRKDKTLFDEDSEYLQNPLNGVKGLDNYDKQFVNDSEFMRKDFCHTLLIRNGQFISCIPIDGFRPSNVRGSCDSSLKILRTHSELRVYTNSYQNNPLDDIIGIQLNKNQHSGILPEELNRIIRFLRTKKYDSIETYFKTKMEEKNKYLKELEKKLAKENKQNSKINLLLLDDDFVENLSNVIINKDDLLEMPIVANSEDEISVHSSNSSSDVSDLNFIETNKEKEHSDEEINEITHPLHDERKYNKIMETLQLLSYIAAESDSNLEFRKIITSDQNILEFSNILNTLEKISGIKYSDIN